MEGSYVIREEPDGASVEVRREPKDKKHKAKEGDIMPEAECFQDTVKHTVV